MLTFHVADLSAQGEIRATQAYDYATLERVPGCVELIARFSGRLYQAAEEFDLQLTLGPEPVSFRWRASSPTSGIATIRTNGELASLSLLATGRVPAADEITFQAFQRHLMHELHDTGFEPGFGLMDLAVRPLVATINFHSPSDETARVVVALADRCFAASYFRFHGLA